MTPSRPARRPSLEEVAERAGVSRATASRVVNGATFVNDELRERVEVAIRELGYQPNLSARALVTGRTDTIALVASEPDVRVFSDPFFGAILRGVTTEANAVDLQVMLLMAQDDHGLDRIRRYVRTGATDGVLLISEHLSDDPVPQALAEAGIPLVVGGRPASSLDRVPYVDNDNVHGGRLAARHLVRRGHQRIAILAGPDDMTASLDRLDGFRRELGPRRDDDLVEHCDFTRESGRAAMERLLARTPDVDAIFAASDLIALGALSVLKDAGRRVPDDVALVGFDDIPLAASVSPSLTTIRQDPIRQGRAMLRLLLRQIRPDPAHVGDVADHPATDHAVHEPGGQAPVTSNGADHLVLPVELVERESA
jgi:DNA-binding LacI/PurR family transcriptional regulator